MPKARAYRDFRIGDIFDIHPTSAYKLTNDGLFKQAGKNPVVANGSINNGIVGFSSLETTEKGNMITFSDTTTSDAIFYQPNDFIGYPHVQGLYPKKYLNEWNEVSLLYFLTAFKKCAYGRFDYGTKFTRVLAADMQVKMPVNDRGEIDFLFIDNYMQAIKDYRIKELNDYLDAAGFGDCTLTTEEKQTLAKFDLKTFDNQRIGDYYKKVELKKSKFNKRRDTKQTPDAQHFIPLVNAKHGDNGIMYYGDPNVFDAVEMTIDIVQNGAIATGDVYPQPQKTGILWDAYLIQAIRHKESIETLIFFSTAIEKSIKKKYSYDNKAYWEHVKNDFVTLPVTTEGDADYAFMETYIRAIMKQTIGKLKAAMEIDSKDTTIEENIPIILDSVPASDRFTRFLPLYDVAIACGALVDEGVQSLDNNDVDMEGWIDVSDYGFKPNEQMFIVHAKGESMVPKIHPGDLCVFELYGSLGNAGSRDGQIVLARQHGKDNDYNCQYTIKEYHSEKDPRTGRNVKVELRPLNQAPQYKVIDVEDEDGEVRIVATLKRVLN